MSAITNRIAAEVGVTRSSDWITVDQTMIDRFADATFDHQFIHVDPVRAAASPFGGTVAHGFLTVSLLPKMLSIFEKTDETGEVIINYGLERVRFIHPVRVGRRIRAVFTLTSSEEKRPGRFLQSTDIVIEIEGESKPAMSAIWLTQMHI